MSIEDGETAENFTVTKGAGEVVYNLMVGRRRPDRKAWGVSDLVLATGASRNTVYGWMRGIAPMKYYGPLAKALGVTADVLLHLERPEERGDISGISALYGTEGIPPGIYDSDATIRALGLISQIRVNPPVGVDGPPDVRTTAELVDTAERVTGEAASVHKRRRG